MFKMAGLTEPGKQCWIFSSSYIYSTQIKVTEVFWMLLKTWKNKQRQDGNSARFLIKVVGIIELRAVVQNYFLN